MSEKCEKDTTMTGETCQGELDQLVQEECGDWIFRLIEEGKEPNPAGVCLGPSSSEFIQGSLTSHEGSPDYSKWVSSDYFGKMVEWLADADLGKPPSDEEEARSWFGIGWAEEVVRTVSLWYIFHIFLNIFYTCYSHFLCIFHYVLCDFPYDFPSLI